MVSFKIKDNEMCPCGSNITFVNCCKGKVATIPNSKKPPEVQLMEQMRSSMRSCCMHPDKDHCKGKIKAAHALQNNKIISLLAGDERHVYMMNSKRQPLLIPLENGDVQPIIEISKVSANDATTENCFCDYHDNIAFAPIEKGAPDFDGSNLMCFVYAYKAFVFEYYKQTIALEIYRKCFKKNPSAYLDKNMVGIYRMLQLKSKEFDPIKKHFDSEILSGTSNGIYTCIVEIPEQIHFADYAYVAPSYDMNGKRIHHTQKGVMHRLALTIFPEQNRSWLLLSCMDNEKRIFADLFEQLKSAELVKLKFYLNMILPLLSENMVLSPTLWNKMDRETQTAYTFYANQNGPDAVRMETAIGFGLKNIASGKVKNGYEVKQKLNLFV